MRKNITVVLPMPPTSNNIYVNRYSGGRVKTTLARSWQTKAVKSIVREANLGFQDGLDPNKQYLLIMVFYFDKIVNKGWNEFWKQGKKAGHRKSNTKWRKIDLSNRVKLAEDAMKTASGIDDSATMIHLLVKKCDPDNPRLVMQLLELKESDDEV